MYTSPARFVSLRGELYFVLFIYGAHGGTEICILSFSNTIMAQAVNLESLLPLIAKTAILIGEACIQLVAEDMENWSTDSEQQAALTDESFKQAVWSAAASTTHLTETTSIPQSNPAMTSERCRTKLNTVSVIRCVAN